MSETVRCAIYTRKSTEEGLDSDFNTLDAQREAAESFIASQKEQGWRAVKKKYDDGGFTGANVERPALQELLGDVEAGKVDCIVVYKVDRLSRSLLDFAHLIATFDQHNVSFVSVTQQFNTTTSMGRLTLNILLSFAQFEREIISERIRDKVLAARRKGRYTGGAPVFGYDVKDRKFTVNKDEAQIVRWAFRRFLSVRSTLTLGQELSAKGYKTKAWTTRKGKKRGGLAWHKTNVHRLLTNPLYVGEVKCNGDTFPGEHEAIIPRELWDKVQALLKENSRSRAPTVRQKIPALLRGIIRCGHCNAAMRTTYTKKRGKRYRYYVCNHADKHGYEVCPLRTLNAGEVEDLVTSQVRDMLKSPETIMATNKVYQDTPETVVADALRNIDTVWDILFPVEQARIVSLLVESITVTTGGIDMQLRTLGMQSLVAELNTGEKKSA